MFTPENFKHLNYIKKEPLTGSYQGMRYMLSKKKKEEETYMQGVVWPEPFGFHATKEEQKIYQDFTLDADGLADAIAWLNAMYEKFRKD